MEEFLGLQYFPLLRLRVLIDYPGHNFLSLSLSAFASGDYTDGEDAATTNEGDPKLLPSVCLSKMNLEAFSAVHVSLVINESTEFN